MPIQQSGYLIVMRAEAMLRIYAQTPFARAAAEVLQQLQGALGFLDPIAYRGMGRRPLDPYPTLDPAIIEAFRASGLDMDSNRAARTRLCEIVGDDVPEEYEERLVSTLDEARDVSALLDTPADWEIIHVAVAPLAPSERTLGYDLGWWGGEFYSLIGDCAVDPTWHPPDPNNLHELASQLRVLNPHLLFDSPEDALAFKRYYKTKPWAETEDAEDAFKVARVDAV